MSSAVAFYRIIWPSRVLQNMGVDVKILPPNGRDEGLQGVVEHGRLVDVKIPEDADVIVLQRVSHKFITQAIPLIREKGVAVVVEIDDDLTRIDPRNPAFDLLSPALKKDPRHADHSWHNTVEACKSATMVVVSTPALLNVFARHGRGRVFDNYVEARLLDIPRVDHPEIGWAGSVHSHPGDLQVMGSSVNRLSQEGYNFAVIGSGEGVRQAWGVPADMPLRTTGPTTPQEWGAAVATLGISVTPLADTKFNAAKSWLKVAESMAVGVPTIASPRAEYVRLEQKGAPVTLAKDDKDWYRHMKSLAERVGYREELSQAGREFMRGMTIEGNAWKLAEIWREALTMERGKAFGAHSRRRQG